MYCSFWEEYRQKLASVALSLFTQLADFVVHFLFNQKYGHSRYIPWLWWEKWHLGNFNSFVKLLYGWRLSTVLCNSRVKNRTAKQRRWKTALCNGVIKNLCNGAVEKKLSNGGVERRPCLMCNGDVWRRHCVMAVFNDELIF